MAIESQFEMCPHHWVIDAPLGSVGWEKVTSYGRTVNQVPAVTAATTLSKT
jgi:hypothetical protein